MIDDIDLSEISHRSLIKKIDYFTSNLCDNHELPGQVYETLIGIGYWARENEFLTSKQKWYVIKTLEKYQDQLDPFKIY